MGKAENRVKKLEEQMIRLSERREDPEAYLTEYFYAFCCISKDSKKATKHLLKTKYGYTPRDLDLRSYRHNSLHYGIPRKFPKR